MLQVWVVALHYAVDFFFFLLFFHRELHSLIKSHNCVKGPSHNHLEGGISFGIGAFNLVRPKSLFRHRQTISR